MLDKLKKALKDQNLKVSYDFKSGKFVFSNASNGDVVASFSLDELEGFGAEASSFLEMFKELLRKIEEVFASLNS